MNGPSRCKPRTPSRPPIERAACDGGPHLLASIGDQGWEARCRAKAAVCPGNSAHAFDRRLIVEENAATAVDLQIYEAWSQEGAGRKARLRPIGRDLTPGPKPDDAAVPDQHRGFDMPTVAVKNAVRQDGMTVCD